MLIISDSSTQMAAVRTGQVDASPQLTFTWDDLEMLLKTAPDLNYVKTDGSHLALWGRMDKPELPFDDLRVRQAMNMAIDKQSIVDDYYKGHADLCAPLYPLSKAFEDLNTPFEQLPRAAQDLFIYNPERAKQLLTEAGYPDGFKTEIACVSTDADYLAIIKEYLNLVNIDLEITPFESSVFMGLCAGEPITR
jgi:peptide/nickel transport system substrate-binding protein